MPEHVNNSAEVRTPQRFRFHPAQQQKHPSRHRNLAVPNRRPISFIYGALNKHYLILAFQEVYTDIRFQCVRRYNVVYHRVIDCTNQLDN
jgi:hypothetical protein